MSGPMPENGELPTITRQMREDSERWFPDMHARSDSWLLTVAYTLGLAGEVGEVANLIKKANRGHHTDATVLDTLGEELADCLTYLLLLADEQGVDLEAEWLNKRDRNERRWGG